jgi:hypothetical protein
MDTLYNDKLKLSGLYAIVFPHSVMAGGVVIKTFKIGRTHKPFAKRNATYPGNDRKERWKSQLLLPLDSKYSSYKFIDEEKDLKHRLREYSRKHPYQIRPQSKHANGEYFDVNIEFADRFTQAIYDAFDLIRTRQHDRQCQMLRDEIVQLRSRLSNDPSQPADVGGAPNIVHESESSVVDLTCDEPTGNKTCEKLADEQSVWSGLLDRFRFTGEK